MRNGSTSLGSLGAIPTRFGTRSLILPVLAAIATLVAPATAEATEKLRSAAERGGEVRDALTRRRQWLQSLGILPKSPALLASGKVKPVRVFRTRATWYGPGFHGRRTASGERFDQNAMTLASRHLPFGTRVRITNLKNGKSVIGRVNDRGPFRRGYGVDLSRAMARKIGLQSGPVRVEVLPSR